VVKKYNKILQKELQRLRLPQRLFLLETKVRAGVISKAQAKEYEAVHVAGLHCKAHAKRKCRKMKIGAVDWSPAYQQSRDAIELRALLRRKKLGMKVSSRWLRWWIRKTKAVIPWGRKGLIPDTVSTKNHRRYWRRSLETTASEPRGLHNGHYKAGARSESASQFDAALRNIPYHTGYRPETWCNNTDLAIEKAQGCS
jgi:hypothetical protein